VEKIGALLCYFREKLTRLSGRALQFQSTKFIVDTKFQLTATQIFRPKTLFGPAYIESEKRFAGYQLTRFSARSKAHRTENTTNKETRES
jgi:hypothetical protein